MSETKPTVFVVDDDPGMRDSLQDLIESWDLPVQTYSSAEEFLEGYESRRTGCLLLDLRMPRMGGLILQERLSRQQPPLPVIVITGHGDIAQASQSFRMGAVDFLSKPFDGGVLLQRIQEALRKDTDSRQSLARAQEIRERIGLLSERESEVLALLVAGESNKAIAFKLGIATRTVEDHRARIMDKMQVISLAELVRLVVQSDAGRS